MGNNRLISSLSQPHLPFCMGAHRLVIWRNIILFLTSALGVISVAALQLHSIKNLDHSVRLYWRIPLSRLCLLTKPNQWGGSVKIHLVLISIDALQEMSIHLTCATDTSNIRELSNAVTDMLIKNFLKDCGIY